MSDDKYLRELLERNERDGTLNELGEKKLAEFREIDKLPTYQAQALEIRKKDKEIEILKGQRLAMVECEHQHTKNENQRKWFIDEQIKDYDAEIEAAKGEVK